MHLRISADVEARIATADAAEPDQRFDAALDVPSLEAVFAIVH